MKNDVEKKYKSMTGKSFKYGYHCLLGLRCPMSGPAAKPPALKKKGTVPCSPSLHNSFDMFITSSDVEETDSQDQRYVFFPS